MNVKNAVKALMESDPKLDQEHGRWNSSRLWVLLIFGSMVLWVSKGVLAHENLVLVFKLAVAFIIGNTVTKCFTIAANAVQRAVALKVFMKDGKLSAVEQTALNFETK